MFNLYYCVDTCIIHNFSYVFVSSIAGQLMLRMEILQPLTISKKVTTLCTLERNSQKAKVWLHCWAICYATMWLSQHFRIYYIYWRCFSLTTVFLQQIIFSVVLLKQTSGRCIIIVSTLTVVLTLAYWMLWVLSAQCVIQNAKYQNI